MRISHSDVTQIVRAIPPSSAVAVGAYAQSNKMDVDIVPLADDGCPHPKLLIVLMELERPLFDDMGATEWTKVQDLLKNADSALRITNGDLMTGGEPRYAMINGFACGFRAKMTKSRLLTLGFDQGTNFSSLETKRQILELANRCSVPVGYVQHMEYSIMRGIPYFSRLIFDSDLNDHQEGEAHGVDTLDWEPFQDLSEIGCEMSTGSTGILQSVFFPTSRRPSFLG